MQVKFLDLDGKPQEIEASGLLATCLQHEIDHTNGVLFIDHISKLKRDMVMKKFKKAAKARRAGEAAVRGQRAFASYRLSCLAPSPFEVARSAGITSGIEAARDRCDWAPCPPPDLHGHARFRGADADRARRARARHRRGLYARGQARRRAAWSCSRARSSARRGGSALPVLTPKTLRDLDAQAAFRAHKADAAVVVAYGLILPKPILDAPRLGCFNVHASLLPRWRGAAPINRAIMAGDAETGVTIMKMDEGLDTGAMAMAERTPIAPDMTAGDLHDVLARLGADLMHARAGGARARHAHADAAAGGGRHLRRQDRQGRDAHRLDASRGKQVHDHIRGLSPFPGAWFEIDGARVKALRSTKGEGSGAPGTVLDDKLTIACGEGAVRLTQVQRAGKQPMSAEEFLRGTPVEPGTRLA